jgi:hypothetical protein
MDAEDYKQYREAQKERRRKRLPGRTQEILDLEKQGYKVRKLTDYQYRINEQIDLYPIHRNFHHIGKNKRGTYKNALELIQKYIKP